MTVSAAGALFEGALIEAARPGASPPMVRSIVARSVTDTIAVASAGSADADADALRRAMRLDRSFVGVAAPDAAMHDAFAAHAYDFDDVDEFSMAHLSAVVVPALLAVERYAASEVIDFVGGYAAAYQAAAGLAIALDARLHYARGWHNSATIGGPATVIGLARALGLSGHATRSALGIAASLAAGSRQNFGTSTKPLHVAFAAATAVRAIEFALQGMDADDHAIGGPLGFVALHSEGGDLVAARETLKGESVLLSRPPSTKLFACCYALQHVAHAASTLSTVETSRIRQVRVIVSRGAMLAVRADWPDSARQAQFSVPFVAWVALSTGSVGLTSVPHAGSEVPKPPADVTISVRESTESDAPPDAGPDFAVVEIVTDQGLCRGTSTELPAAGADAVAQEMRARKVEDCLRFARMDGTSAELSASVEPLIDSGRSRALRAWLARSGAVLAATTPPAYSLDQRGSRT